MSSESMAGKIFSNYVNLIIYLENLSVWVSLKDGLDGHGEGRPSLTKRVGILVRHPVATPLQKKSSSEL